MNCEVILSPQSLEALVYIAMKHYYENTDEALRAMILHYSDEYGDELPRMILKKKSANADIRVEGSK